MGQRTTLVSLAGGALAVVLLTHHPVPARDEGPDQAALEKQRCPRPAELASVFSFGYAGDNMPKDDGKFDELLGKLEEAGFNTVHCTYTDRRLASCKKHRVKMMVDLLSEEHHHVYRSPDRAKAVCEKLRNDPDVWGYNVWNDPFGKAAEGRRRDVNNVRRWDPTHPAYCGTYRTDGMRHLTNADVLGYYDFHWSRGPQQHFPHLLQYRQWARERNACFYRWLETDAGLAGKGNFNRSLWSVNTSIACGLKGVLWFLGGRMMDPKTLEWTAAGKDIIKVNREVMPLAAEVGKLGNPAAVWSTPVTRTLKNEPLPDGKKEMMPPGLEGSPFPDDFWLQPAGGEFLMGVFKGGNGPDAVFIANHNPYARQSVTLKVARPGKVERFDRKAGKWRPLEVKDGAVAFELDEGGGELLRFPQ